MRCRNAHPPASTLLLLFCSESCFGSKRSRSFGNLALRRVINSIALLIAKLALVLPHCPATWRRLRLAAARSSHSLMSHFIELTHYCQATLNNDCSGVSGLFCSLERSMWLLVVACNIFHLPEFSNTFAPIERQMNCSDLQVQQMSSDLHSPHTRVCVCVCTD